MWSAVAQKFEEKTGYRVEVVDTGTVDVIAETFAAGGADLLTMHSSDTTTNLVADGYGANMQPWTHNELVIMGPASDPAGIKGMTDGVEAVQKIAAAGELGRARFVDLWGTGKREVRAHNEMERLRRARADVSRSAATACVMAACR